MALIKYYICFLFALLTAKCSNAKWLCENPKSQAFVSGNTVSVSGHWSSHHRNPLLCLYKGLTITNGNYYFELKVEGNDAKVEVGLTTDDALNGYPYKGFFYSSYLTDGLHILRKHFGQTIDSDDSVDSDSIEYIIKIRDGKIDLYFTHFGVPLGLALSTTKPSAPLFPAVRLFGDGKVTFIAKEFKDTVQLERSKNLLEGIFQFSSFKEEDTDKDLKCLDDAIQFYQFSFGHSDEQDENFLVSFNNGKKRGLLWKDDGEWNYANDDTGAAIDGSQISDCVTFIESVLKNTVSLTHKDSTVVVQSRYKERSFEAKKVGDLSPETVTKNVFDGND